jgi:hypothetical protein
VDDARVALGGIALWRRLYLTAKSSHVGVNVGRLACSLHRPTTWCHQTRGQGFLLGMVLSHRVAEGGGAFSGVQSPQTWIFDVVLIVWVPALSNLLRGVNHFYQGMLIPCQSHHDAYACIPSRATASGGDGTFSSN